MTVRIKANESFSIEGLNCNESYRMVPEALLQQAYEALRGLTLTCSTKGNEDYEGGCCPECRAQKTLKALEEAGCK